MKEPRIYYVTGKNFYGGIQTVKTYARSAKEAKDNALWILETATRAVRG